MDIPYKFCPKCGGDFEQELENKFVCIQCAFEFFVNPAPCVGILLFDEQGRILLGRRKFEPHKGTWATIGGFADPGESIEEVAMRETKEELGIEIYNIRYIGSATDLSPRQECVFPTLPIIVEAASDQLDQIKPNDDVVEARFFAADEIPYDEITMEYLVPFLKRYMEKRNNI